MVRPLNSLILAAGILAASAPALPAQTVDPTWLKWDTATSTVTFELIAGSGAAKSPFNFNGFVGGDASLIVPPKSTVVLNFINKDGTPHSAMVIEDKDPMPVMADTPAIPRALTRKATEGLAQEATDVIRFTAPASGSFRIFCAVPGHGLSGMWIYFKVDPAAKEPRFEVRMP
ncbi:MAG TPA: sulfocyanin-like copper-binding protein [Gemmatimonadales bacterium]|nr:sulfocyanin-like copper-binding protein [Gemmatimonadales bacterium]